MSNKSIKSLSASHNYLNISLNYLGTKKRLRFSGTCLKQDKITYNHGKIVSIYIAYEINKKKNSTSSHPALENCLFGVVSLTKSTDIDKYKYPGYEIGFDRHGHGFFFSSYWWN